jgi:predicted hydrolase (HD superfamily)
MVTQVSELVDVARDLAEVLLADLPERWRHTAGVARRAEELAGVLGRDGLGPDGEILVATAWLHDIGYAAPLHDTGFHPLDGARHLESRGWSSRIAALVAHHSEASCVARARGLAGQLAAYPKERTLVSDALAYADQAVGPNGVAMALDLRFRDMLARHGANSANAAAHAERAPLLRAAVGRVDRQLAANRQLAATR